MGGLTPLSALVEQTEDNRTDAIHSVGTFGSHKTFVRGNRHKCQILKFLLLTSQKQTCYYVRLPFCYKLFFCKCFALLWSTRFYIQSSWSSYFNPGWNLFG